MKEIHLEDNGKAIQVKDIKTDEMLYQWSYRDNEKNLIWNIKDSWRQLRANFLRQDLYKELFKCECGKFLEIPDKFEARNDGFNYIEFDLNCECGNKITIETDTLRFHITLKNTAPER